MEQIAWSSLLEYDSDVCLGIEIIEGPIPIVLLNRSLRSNGEGDATASSHSRYGR